jgi:ABC-type phosphate/phosphonate transport system permease subunit
VFIASSIQSATLQGAVQAGLVGQVVALAAPADSHWQGVFYVCEPVCVYVSVYGPVCVVVVVGARGTFY